MLDILYHLSDLFQKINNIFEIDHLNDREYQAFKSVQSKDINKLKKIVDSGFDINKIFDMSYYSDSLFSYACKNGNKEIVEYLISKGAKINKKIGKYAPLYIACSSGDISIVELLINNGADINQMSGNDANYGLGENAVSSAISNKNFDMVKLLLEKGALVNNKDPESYSYLIEAIEGDNPKIAKILLEYGANVNTISEGYGSPLNMIINKISDDNELNKFIKDNPKEDKNKIIEYYFKSYKELGRLVFEASEEKDEVDYSIFEDYNNLEKTTNFKESVNENGTGILEVAIKSNNKDFVEYLIKNKISLSLDSTKDAIFSASSRGFIDIVDIFLKNGFDINYKSKTLSTSLLKDAYSHNQLELLKFLFKNGAKVDETISLYDIYNTSSEELENEFEAIKLMIKNGVNINDKHDSLNILKQFIYSRDSEAVEYLLKNGFKIDFIDLKKAKSIVLSSKVTDYYNRLEFFNGQYEYYNNTELMLACKYGNKDIVDLLIKNGANVNFRNSQGWTPLLITREYIDSDKSKEEYQNADFDKVEELLIKAGAKE